MKNIMSTTGVLANSWYSAATSKITDTVDISCISLSGANVISVGSGSVIALQSTGDMREFKGYQIGYNSTYVIT